MEKSPFFPSLLQSALPSSIIILSRISLLYRRVFVTVDLPNFTRLRNESKNVTKRNESGSAGARTTRAQITTLHRHNSSILIFYMKRWDEKKREGCEFIEKISTFNNVKYRLKSWHVYLIL